MNSDHFKVKGLTKKQLLSYLSKLPDEAIISLHSKDSSVTDIRNIAVHYPTNKLKGQLILS